MKKMTWIMMAVLLVAGAGYSALLTVDFETNTVSSVPLGYTAIRPSPMTATQYINTVSSTLLGGSQAIKYLDQSSSSSAGGIEYNFVPSGGQGAVKFRFSFSPQSISGTSSNYISIGIGGYSVSNSLMLGSSANMYAEMRVTGDGTVRVYSNGVNVAISSAALNSSNTFTMIVNDTDAAVSYSGYSDNSVAANTVDYYLNGTRLFNDAALAVISAGTTNGLGRIGFVNGSTRIGLDYLIDNISVEVIPEPATIGMLGLGALITILVRRMRR